MFFHTQKNYQFLRPHAKDYADYKMNKIYFLLSESLQSNKR